MTLEQKKLIACAELAGDRLAKCGLVYSCTCVQWKRQHTITFDSQGLRESGRVACPFCDKPFKQKTHYPPYTTSLDAIVPVVIKVFGDDEQVWYQFAIYLGICGKPFEAYEVIRLLFGFKPSQIFDALLLAAGKMPVE